MGTSISHRGGSSRNFVTAVSTPAKVMVTTDVLFTIVDGPIQIKELFMVCVTDNDATATLVRWRFNPTVGMSATFSAASTTIASVAAGTVVTLNPSALTSLPIIDLPAAGGIVTVSSAKWGVILREGNIALELSVGSTTGTWKHHLSYLPMSENAYVIAA